MTSNIRSADLMREHFRPEFLNRIDEIVEFQALTREQLADIVELQLARLRERPADRRRGLLVLGLAEVDRHSVGHECRLVGAAEGQLGLLHVVGVALAVDQDDLAWAQLVEQDLLG